LIKLERRSFYAFPSIDSENDRKWRKNGKLCHGSVAGSIPLARSGFAAYLPALCAVLPLLAAADAANITGLS